MKVFLFLLCTVQVMAHDITGIWKSTQYVVRIFEYEQKCYGQVLSTLDEEGYNVVDTINDPQVTAEGIEDEPYKCGLILMWDMAMGNSNHYHGKIIDLDSGKVYKTRTWRMDDNTLNVETNNLLFWINEQWVKAEAEDYPAQLPPIENYLPPVIPKAM